MTLEVGTAPCGVRRLFDAYGAVLYGAARWAGASAAKAEAATVDAFARLSRGELAVDDDRSTVLQLSIEVAGQDGPGAFSVAAARAGHSLAAIADALGQPSERVAALMTAALRDRSLSLRGADSLS